MAVRALATDGVVFLDEQVVLLRRDHSPHEGEWVLPGGLVERGERAAAACEREVREEVGMAVEPVAFVGLYDDPDRDPRGNVTAAYRCVPTRPAQTPRARAEATAVDTFDPDALPTMGFDHARIVAKARSVDP